MALSVIGLIVALAVLAPSMLLVVLPPRPPVSLGFSAGRLATALERCGQVGCLAFAAAFGPHAASPPAFVVVTAGLVAGYWALWLRYVLGGRRARDLFAPVGPVPVPMAVLPVLTFATLAAWAASPWLALAALALAAGHVPNSWAGRLATR